MAALLIAAVPASPRAHTHHHEAADSAAVAAPDTAGVREADTTYAAHHAGAGRREHPAPTPYVMPPMRLALGEHLHNKLVHFPLALALSAALLLVVARRRPDLEMAGRWFVRLAALGGVAAWVTGRLQEEAFEGEPKAWLVDLHERWGTATSIALVVWALLTLWRPARRHAWLVGLVAAALVLITGFYGGVVAHGE